MRWTGTRLVISRVKTLHSALFVQDGKISEEELMEAFLRQEMLTTLLVNKVMQRAVTAKVNILKD